MTLLITTFAAIISTVVWYNKMPDNAMKTGILSLMFWGASLMWLVDAVVEYINTGADYFKPSAEVMLNDLFLGLSVVPLGLVVWLIIILIKDPKGVLGKMLHKK